MSDESKEMNYKGAKSQKAKSLAALEVHEKQLLNSDFIHDSVRLKALDYHVITDPINLAKDMLPAWINEELVDDAPEGSWAADLVPKIFARCCPTKPEHGFEDSIPVRTYKELFDLWDRMIKIDVNAEMVLMRYIQADCSGIITPFTLSVGSGHDGATNGVDPLILNYNSTIPSAQSEVPFLELVKSNGTELNMSWGNLAANSGIPGWKSQLVNYPMSDEWSYIEGEPPSSSLSLHPYVEVVCDRVQRHTPMFKVNAKAQSTESWMVQCRAGTPIGSAVHDYCPKDIAEVQNVVVPTGKETLPEWRDMCAAFPEDTVVYHPGGAITSHWGVNCAEKGIPYFTKYKPSEGEELAASDFDSLDFKFQGADVVSGIAEALRNNHTGVTSGIKNRSTIKMEEALALCIFALHNYRIQSPAVGSRLFGLGVGYCMRLLTAACLGEYRHKATHGPGGKSSNPNGLGRAQIHDLVWESYYGEQEHMHKILKCFRDNKWGGSFGGKKWAQCVENQLIMHHIACDMAQLYKSKNSGKKTVPQIGWTNKEMDFSDLIDHLTNYGVKSKLLEYCERLSTIFNETINLCHNNGWVFNKFSGHNLCEAGSKSTLDFAAMCMPGLNIHRQFLNYGSETNNLVKHQLTLNPFDLYRSRESLTNLYHYKLPNDPVYVYYDSFTPEGTDKQALNTVLIDKAFVKKKGMTPLDFVTNLRSSVSFEAIDLGVTDGPKLVDTQFRAQACLRVHNYQTPRGLKTSCLLHIQWKHSTSMGDYEKLDIPLDWYTLEDQAAIRNYFNKQMKIPHSTITSMAGGTTQYIELDVIHSFLAVSTLCGDVWRSEILPDSDQALAFNVDEGETDDSPTLHHLILPDGGILNNATGGVVEEIAAKHDLSVEAVSSYAYQARKLISKHTLHCNLINQNIALKAAWDISHAPAPAPSEEAENEDVPY